MALLRSLLPTACTAPGRFAVLRLPEFRRFWYAALVDDIANWLLFAAQSWLVLRLTGGAQPVALFLALRMGPKVLLGLPAGALSDRRGPLRVLRGARFASGLPALLIILGAVLGRLDFELVLLSAALASAVQAFDQPAHRSLIHQYAPGRLLVGGLALNSTSGTLSALIGPLIFAAMMALPGVLWALPVQMALAATSGLILLRNRTGTRPRHASASDAKVSNDCLLAVRYLAATPALLALILLAGSPGLLDRLLTVFTPDYAGGQHAGAGGMTLLFMAPATGALVGGSLLAWLGGEVQRLFPLMLGSTSVAVVSVSLLATTRMFMFSLLLFVLLGAAKAAFSVAIMAALQRRVPDHARGRLLAL